MIALRLLMLVVAVALIYAMFVKSQMKTEALPPELVQTSAPAGSPGSLAARPPQRAHGQYKEAMDRAHAAAKSMQAQHADADSF